jgi:hypothetical protein
LDHNCVKDSYEDGATAFAVSAHGLVYQHLAEPLVAAAMSVKRHRCGRVLDVAAGAGAFGRAFPDVVALDISKQMLTANPSPRRVQAEGDHLPFRDDAFSIAGCTFGINHVTHPDQLVREMTRVAPVVAVSTWLRPEPEYAPKLIVHDVLDAQLGTHRTAAGRLLDHLSDGVGSVDAVTRLLSAAGLDAAVHLAEVTIAWPGVDAYLDYRLGMPSTPRPRDLAALRAVLAEKVDALPSAACEWHAALVIGLGVRGGRSCNAVATDGEIMRS